MYSYESQVCMPSDPGSCRAESAVETTEVLDAQRRLWQVVAVRFAQAMIADIFCSVLLFSVQRTIKERESADKHTSFHEGQHAQGFLIE